MWAHAAAGTFFCTAVVYLSSKPSQPGNIQVGKNEEYNKNYRPAAADTDMSSTINCILQTQLQERWDTFNFIQDLCQQHLLKVWVT